VALVVVVVLVAWLVPSRVPKTSNASATQTTGNSATATSGTGTGTTAAASTGASSKASGGTSATPASHTGLVASGGTAGRAATAGTSGTSGSSSGGHTVTTPGKVQACGGQQWQVPGDPYSPPCTLFSGNNGGATATGVTATTINVSFRLTSDQSFQQTLAQLAGASLQDTNADDERTIDALAQYFNTHFQFYGRKIVVHFYNGQGSLTNELLGTGQEQAEEDAETAKAMKVFADLSAESEPYATDLANEGILAFGDPYLSRQWHQQHAPYAWSSATDGTDVALLAADYAVQRLCPAGSPAAYAGGSLKNAPRKFALLAPENSWYQVSVQVAQQYMQQHGCNAQVFTYSLDLGTESQQAANLAAQMKNDGITTIICGCDPIFPVYFSGQAYDLNYFPEFIITGTALTDQDYVGQLWNQSFAAHALGISPNAPTVPYTQTLGYAAYETVRTDQPAFFVNQIYEQMDMMAIGLQMAGPNLTPQSFQQGMFNYPARLGPYGLWGFSPDQYTIPNDVREICWSPTALSAYNNKPGAFLGTSSQRWAFGDIPKGAPGCPIPS
jgi:hypothetical protein